MAAGWSATPQSITKGTIQELGIIDVVRRTLVDVVVLDDQFLHGEASYIERADLKLVEFAACDAQLVDAQSSDRKEANGQGTDGQRTDRHRTHQHKNHNP